MKEYPFMSVCSDLKKQNKNKQINPTNCASDKNCDVDIFLVVTCTFYIDKSIQTWPYDSLCSAIHINSLTITDSERNVHVGNKVLVLV